MTRQTGVRDQVMEIVARQYPCGSAPDGALSEIAREVGVSRERVRQIVRSAGIGWMPKHPAKVHRPCRLCGLPVMTPRKLHCEACRSIPAVCATCGKSFTMTATRLKTDLRDSRRRNAGAIFCSRACRRPTGKSEGRSVDFACAWCGKKVRMFASRARRQKCCSRVCAQQLRWAR